MRETLPFQVETRQGEFTIVRNVDCYLSCHRHQLVLFQSKSHCASQILSEADCDGRLAFMFTSVQLIQRYSRDSFAPPTQDGRNE